jgi:hypothetical protein
MGLLTGVGDFFRGAFGEDEEEKRRRKQREAQAAAQRQQAQKAAESQQKTLNKPQTQAVSQLFGNKTEPNQQPTVNKKPTVTPTKPVEQVATPAPKPQAPVQPTVDYNALKLKAQGYQNPQVQDVKNYYGNDLKVLNEELAKGDKADQHRIAGIMQSLDNRKKELTEFHNERGNNDSFKTARELSDTIQKTRGDWTTENAKLQQFWDGVSENEAADFETYLKTKKLDSGKMTNAAMLTAMDAWKTGTGQYFGADFKNDTERVKQIKQRQEIADAALQFSDTPLDQLNNQTLATYLSEFNNKNANEQRNILRDLEKSMKENGKNFTGDPALDRKLQQTFLLHTVLMDRGERKHDWNSNMKDFGAGVARFGTAMATSPARVAQSIGVLMGDDPGADIEKDYKTGVIDKETYNRKMNNYDASLQWVGDGSKGRGHDALMAAGISADTVATLLPVFSALKGVKGAVALEALTKAGMKEGLTEEAAKVIAKEALKTNGQSLGRTVIEEGVANAAFSGVGSLRDGEINADNIIKESLIGGTIGAAAPVAGAGATKLWQKLRGAERNAPESLEDIGRVTTRLEDDTAANAAKTAEDALYEKGITNATERELTDVIENEFTLPKVREEAQAQLDSMTAPTPDPLDTPTYQYKQDLQNIIDSENANLTRYINEHPELTAQQIEAAQLAAKQRIIELTDKLKESRYGTTRAVEEQKTANDTTIEGQQATNEAVKAEQAAATDPAPAGASGTPNDPVPGNPEITSNNAYDGQTDESILFGDQPAYQEKGRLSIPQLLSPDRLIREKITRPLENLVNRGVSNLQTSGNRVGQGIGRFFTGGSRELGVSPELQTAKMQLRGAVETGKLYRESIADLSKGMSRESTERVWATLDPEFAARKGMNVGELTPEEAVLQGKLKTLIDNTTKENLRRGLITPEQASAGNYIKRSYSVYDGNTDVGKFEQGFRTELLGQYKGRKVVSDEMVEEAITDPTYLVGKKSAESHAIWAMQDYGNHLNTSGIAIDVPKRGYTQLPDSPVFGDAAGKYVPQGVAEDFTGFQYSSATVSAFNDMITAYDRWGVRQAKKQLLTVFNPAVRLGNQVSNRVIFSQLNGINPAQFNKAMFDVKGMIGSNHPLYREAVQQGLTGIDITQADFFAKRIADGTGDVNIAKQASDWVKTSYSAADDQARIAAYKVYRDRGYTPEEAARTVQRGFQDYKSIGFFYDMAAKTPLIGNAFVRFVADSIRIAKNAVVDHPLRTAGTIALWGTLVNGMSVASGESTAGEEGDSIQKKAFNLATGSHKSEAQKTREGRFGAPKLPFTDISMTMQTPWGELNAARFMPWYQLSGINDNGVEGIAKYLPIAQSPVVIKDGKLEINGAGFADPLLGQVAQLGFDKDFRNRSIQDPQNTGQFDRDQLSAKDKLQNVIRWAGVNNAPLGKEIDQTVSAYAGASNNRVEDGKSALPMGDWLFQKTEGKDLYGKERNIGQAIARDFGVKVEQYGEEQVKDANSMQAYQEEKKQIDEELKGMSKDAQAAYKRLTGYDKLRETVPNEFDPGKDRFVKAPVYDFGEDKWKEYAAHPELYKLMMEKKQREAAKPDGAPLQPEFDPRLSEAFRKQLVQNKMVAPGDDAELDQRMYSSPEWDYYQSLKDAYKEKAKGYYPDNGDDFTDELVKHQDAKFPTKPDILKQYGAAYGLYTAGKANKPEFTDAVKAAKEAYNKQTFDWTNTERKARGLDAINWDMWNNPTFGYDSTPSTSGFGFGGGGGGTYDPLANVNTLGELTNFTNSVKGYGQINPAEAPNLVQIFQKLRAGSSAPRSSRQKPTMGASSRGQG